MPVDGGCDDGGKGEWSDVTTRRARGVLVTVARATFGLAWRIKGDDVERR